MIKARQHTMAAAIQLALLIFFVGSTSAATLPPPSAPIETQFDPLPQARPGADLVIVEKHFVAGASSETVLPPLVKACDETKIAEKVRSHRSRYMPMDDYRKIIKLFQRYDTCQISFEVDMPLAFGGHVPELVEVDLAVHDKHLNGCVSGRYKYARPDFRYTVCFYKNGVTIEQDY